MIIIILLFIIYYHYYIIILSHLVNMEIVVVVVEAASVVAVPEKLSYHYYSYSCQPIVVAKYDSTLAGNCIDPLRLVQTCAIIDHAIQTIVQDSI